MSPVESNDGIIIHLELISLGEDIRLFEKLRTRPIVLERFEVTSIAGVTSLQFKVVNS